MEVARTAVTRMFVPDAPTSREADPVTPMPVCEVSGDVVRAALPWLFERYRGAFRELVQSTCDDEVTTARCDRYAVILNVMRGTVMRYVCHVDSNPVAGLLYVTEHEAGGELVVGQREDARSVAEVEADALVIRPRAGRFVTFDGRRHPHYVRPLRAESDVRVVVAMNYYTRGCPESVRPPELDNGVVIAS